MGLKMLLERVSEFSVVGEAEDGQAAVDGILALKPDVVMMDLGLPKIDGIEATAIIKKSLPSTKVLIFTTAEDDDTIFAALKAGADGYCLKTISPDLLSNAIHSVLSGAAWLDPGIAKKVLASPARQASQDLTKSKLDLLKLVEQGKNLDQIAEELKVNDALVKGLLNELLGQLQGVEKVDATQNSKAPQEITIKAGDVIANHYRIDERVGHGGMGCVYKASHTVIERRVAIKTLHEHLAQESDLLTRFKSEAQASAAVVHPNLVTIYDFGLLAGKVPYIVMEFLEGTDLSTMLEQLGKIDEPTGRKIFLQVLDALSAVHRKGIVHRDLKPSNIMIIATDDDPCSVKLVDFGIAKILDSKRESLTMTGEAIGSPRYMSPEQCRGTTIDHRSDIYSLGCVMFEAFSGQRAFNGGTALEVMMQHINETPSTDLLNQHLSQKTVQLIMSMLEKDPNNRPSSASEIHKVLCD